MQGKILLVSSLALVGCNLDHNLGALDEPQLDASATDDGKAPDTTPASTPDTTGPSEITDPQSPAQSWTGYIENFKFASGSDAIKLVLTTNTTGQVAGTVTLGNGIAPPPATDPNVGYPPGMTTTTTMPNGDLEGSTYAIKSGTLESNRLRFTIDPIELWTGWCALQPAPTDGSDMCVPTVWYSFESDVTRTICVLHPTEGTSVPVDCVKWNLCFMRRICKCSPAGCVVNYEGSGYKTSFDVFLSNGTGNGSMTGVFSDHNVHFTKDP